MQLAVGTQLGPYQIVAQLGAGGMGEVYRARDLRLKRDVAIKVLPAHFGEDPTALKRFEREAESLAALSHPNILTIHDIGIEQNITYIVAELLTGETLRAYINRAPFSVSETLQIAIGILEGLSAAHSKGLIHRDLKPENIFLLSSKHVKILDFGLARRIPIPEAKDLTEASTASVETQFGSIQGTVPYMSPEQLRGDSVDARTDIFSFGCVMYEMLCGQKAFLRQTTVDTISAILNEEPPPLTGVPIQFKELVRGCLEKNIEARFSSAHDVAIAFKSYAANVSSISGLTTAKPVIAKTSDIESIAVLPLDNLSGNPQQQYFADGITEAFIHELGQLKALRVISRTSVMQYKGMKIPLSKIAQELKVQAILEGSVLPAGDRVEISARLVEPETEKRLWGRTYNRDLRDVLTLRKEITQAIVNEIQLAISPEEQKRLKQTSKVDPEAYRYYLRGNFNLNKLNQDSFRTAIVEYRNAINIDPSYAAAYAGLAMAYSELASWSASLHLDEVYTLARAAALTAIELDEKLSEAHFALGILKYLHEWDWEGADAAFRTGFQLNPSSSHGIAYYANYLAAMGRFEDSISIGRKGVDLDPLSPTAYNWLSFCYWFAGKKKEAYEQLDKSLQLDPNFDETTFQRLLFYAFEYKYDAAITGFSNLFGSKLHTAPAIQLAYLGWSCGFAGKVTEALKILEELNRRPETIKSGAAWLAMVELGLGNKDQSIDLLEKAYENHESALVWINSQSHYVFRSLRNHRRFQLLLQRMNFPEI